MLRRDDVVQGSEDEEERARVELDDDDDEELEDSSSWSLEYNARACWTCSIGTRSGVTELSEVAVILSAASRNARR